MSAPSCPVCGGEMRERAATPRLRIARCPVCAHRVAHHTQAGPADDYFAQFVYDRGGFIDALRTTRVRQARRWIALLRGCRPGLRGVLDVGCGHGWFLEQVRSAGLSAAGVDTSSLAVEELRAKGIEAALVDPNAPHVLPPGVPSSPCDAVSLLDVLEHLPPAQVGAVLEGLATNLRPSLVLVKVPSSAGLLYRAASTLARAGIPGPLEQLYQVGTSPPHLSYFSKGSLDRTLRASGLRPVVWARDRDFEHDGLADRVRALSKLPGWASRNVGRGLAALAWAARAEDALVCVAEPWRAPGS